jgi:hypothetical protein
MALDGRGTPRLARVSCRACSHTHTRLRWLGPVTLSAAATAMAESAALPPRCRISRPTCVPSDWLGTAVYTASVAVRTLPISPRSRAFGPSPAPRRHHAGQGHGRRASGRRHPGRGHLLHKGTVYVSERWRWAATRRCVSTFSCRRRSWWRPRCVPFAPVPVYWPLTLAAYGAEHDARTVLWRRGAQRQGADGHAHVRRPWPPSRTCWLTLAPYAATSDHEARRLQCRRCHAPLQVGTTVRVRVHGPCMARAPTD